MNNKFKVHGDYFPIKEHRTQNKTEEQEFRQVANKVQQKNAQLMVKYVFELRKIALVDGLRQIVKSELVNDTEIQAELNTMKNILDHFLRDKEIEQYLATNFPIWDNYHNEIMLANFFSEFESKIKTGEIPVNKIRQIIKKYDEIK